MSGAGNMAGRPCGLYALWSLKEKLSMMTLYCSQCFNSLVGEMVKICWLVLGRVVVTTDL
jgi:hypothetical protein